MSSPPGNRVRHALLIVADIFSFRLYSKRVFGAAACITLLILVCFITNLSTNLVSEDPPFVPNSEAPEPVDVPEPEPTFTPQHNRSECSLMKCTMLYGAHKYPQLEAAVDSHRRHSERWGCGFQNLEYDLTNRRLYSKQYSILSAILHEMTIPEDQRKKWLMWVDADSIVLNPAISPEHFLPPENLKDVWALLTADKNGLNAGIFYLKVHPDSVDFLTQVVAYPLDYPDIDLGWFGVQAAMSKVLEAMKADPRRRDALAGVAWIPRTWINAYQGERIFEGKPGDLMVHFAGLGATRLSLMAKWLDELVQHPAKWEVPLGKTRYEKAVPGFWNQFVSNSTRIDCSPEGLKKGRCVEAK